MGISAFSHAVAFGIFASSRSWRKSLRIWVRLKALNVRGDESAFTATLSLLLGLGGLDHAESGR